MTKLKLAACLMLLVGVHGVGAQVPGTNPSKRPAFSPYLNLNRQGNSAALNYYGLVRPQVKFDSNIQQLQQQSSDLKQQQQQETSASGELPPTGHVSGFLNHNKFFMNRGGSTPLAGRTPPVSTSQLGSARKTR